MHLVALLNGLLQQGFLIVLDILLLIIMLLLAHLHHLCQIVFLAPSCLASSHGLLLSNGNLSLIFVFVFLGVVVLIFSNLLSLPLPWLLLHWHSILVHIIIERLLFILQHQAQRLPLNLLIPLLHNLFKLLKIIHHQYCLHNAPLLLVLFRVFACC